MAFTVAGLERELFQLDVRFGRQQRFHLGVHQLLISRAQLQAERTLLLRGLLLLRQDFILIQLIQRLSRQHIEIGDLEAHVRRTDVLARVGNHAGIVVDLRCQVTGIFLRQVGVGEIADLYLWLAHHLETRVLDFHVGVAQIETGLAFGATRVEGHAFDLDADRTVRRRDIELQIVHVARKAEFFRVGRRLGIQVEA